MFVLGFLICQVSFFHFVTPPPKKKPSSISLLIVGLYKIIISFCFNFSKSFVSRNLFFFFQIFQFCISCLLARFLYFFDVCYDVSHFNSNLTNLRLHYSLLVSLTKCFPFFLISSNNQLTLSLILCGFYSYFIN